MAKRNVFRCVALAGVLFLSLAFAGRCGDTTPPRDATTVLNGIRLKRMTQELTLTEEQQKKIKALLDEEGKKVGVINADETLPLDIKYEKVTAIKKDFQKQMAATMTPEQQTKYEALLAKSVPKKRAVK
jgi:Spy/CpxP family protein refolding chaperone